MACRLSPRNTTVLNSKVISVTVKPPPLPAHTSLEIEFAHMYNVSALHVHVRMHGPLHLCPCVPTSRPLAGLELSPAEQRRGQWLAELRGLAQGHRQGLKEPNAA